MSDLNDADLAPCPFCGSPAEFERKGTHARSCIVACTMCGCSLETGETWNSGKAWNTRWSIERAVAENGGN
jgi:hypothetical protein